MARNAGAGAAARAVVSVWQRSSNSDLGTISSTRPQAYAWAASTTAPVVNRYNAARATDKGREPLDPSPRGHDPERDLREADPNVVGAEPEVGGHRDLGAAAVGVAVQLGDDRRRQRGHAIQDVTHPDRHAVRVGDRAELGELFQVAAGHEDAVAPTAYDEHGGRVGLELLERLLELSHDVERDRIAGRGTVDAQPRRRPLPSQRQHLGQSFGRLLVRDLRHQHTLRYRISSRQKRRVT